MLQAKEWWPKAGVHKQRSLGDTYRHSTAFIVGGCKQKTETQAQAD